VPQRFQREKRDLFALFLPLHAFFYSENNMLTLHFSASNLPAHKPSAFDLLRTQSCSGLSTYYDPSSFAVIYCEDYKTKTLREIGKTVGKS
jgi:hypothetical protein